MGFVNLRLILILTMRLSALRIAIVVAMLALSFNVTAQSLKDGFKELNAGLYPAARKEFTKILTKDSLNPAANYGMAVLYFKNDFANRNTDSAYYFTMLGIRSLQQTMKPNDRLKFEEFGARDANLSDLQTRINERAFQVADSINTVDGWDHFMNVYTTSLKMNEALQRRDEGAYENAKAEGNYQSMEDFMKKYPNSKQAVEANKSYEYLLYSSSTKDSSYQSYKDFMDKYPHSPYYNDAKANYEKLLYKTLTSNHNLQEYIDFVGYYPDNKYAPLALDSIYTIYTRPNTKAILYAFIEQFPHSPYINEAWLRYYNLSLPIYTEEAIKNFAIQNPAFPDKELIKHDVELAHRKMKRIQIDSLYGYEDSVMCDTFIKPHFTQANEFSEELAVVSTGRCNTDTSGNIVNCTYGYINEEGKYIIEPRFSQAYDFKKGIALVSDGICKDTVCYLGFVDRNGNWVIKPIYNDAYEFNCDRALVKINGKGFGYLNRRGEQTIPCHFNDALSFSNCKAGVKLHSKWGFIDTTGTIIIDTMFNEVGVFSEGLAAASDSAGKWGYIDESGKWSIKPQFTSADAFKDGRATVMIEKAVRARRSYKRVELEGERVIDTAGNFVDLKKKKTP